MGSSGSKTARAAGSAARKYPSRPSGTPPPQAATTNAPPRAPPAAARGRPGPTVRPQPQASGARDEAIDLDAADPDFDFARSLRQLGAVQPNPTHSHTSAFPTANSQNMTHFESSNPYPVGPDPRNNPALVMLRARRRIQDEFDAEVLEVGRTGFQGRQFVDVGVVRQILLMRRRGMAGAEIEKSLELKEGVVAKLGAEGIVNVAKD